MILYFLFSFILFYISRNISKTTIVMCDAKLHIVLCIPMFMNKIEKTYHFEVVRTLKNDVLPKCTYKYL